MQYLLRKNEFISESRNILYGYFGTSSADRSHDKGQNIKVGGGEKDICEFVEILPENVWNIALLVWTDRQKISITIALVEGPELGKL